MRNFCKEETLKLLLGIIYASWRHDIKHNNIYNIDIQHNNARPMIKLDTECRLSWVSCFFIIMLSIKILSVFMPSNASIVMWRVSILSVIMPIVIIPSVVAACQLSLLLEVGLLCEVSGAI
jgi:hypothetical protein